MVAEDHHLPVIAVVAMVVVVVAEEVAAAEVEALEEVDLVFPVTRTTEVLQNLIIMFCLLASDEYFLSFD